MSIAARRRGEIGTQASWITGCAVATLIVAAAAAVNPALGVALTVLGAIGLVVANRPHLLLALLVLAIFLEVIDFGGVTITRLIAPVALLVLAGEVLRRGFGLEWSAPLVFVCAYSAWALASSLWTVSPAATSSLLQSLAIALVFMLAFAILPTSERHVTEILYILAFAALVVGTSTVMAVAGRPLGFAGSLQGGRAQGGVGDPSFFANVMLVALPLVIVLAAAARRRWLRWTLFLTVVVIITTILTSLSRGGFLALVAVLLVLPFVPWRALYPSRRHKAVIMLVLLLGGGLLMTRSTVRAEITGRVQSIFGQSAGDPGSDRGSGRETIWAAAKMSVSERPLLGLGFGAFVEESNQLMLRTPNASLSNFKLRKDGSEAHNAFLGTTAEIGFPGLLLFLGILVSTAMMNIRTYRRAMAAGIPLTARLAAALVLSLVGWTVSSLFISTETARPLWIAIGLSLALAKITTAREWELRGTVSPGRDAEVATKGGRGWGRRVVAE